MTTYRLVDHGYPWKVIVCGRSSVGRVAKHADGGYVGMIGSDSVRAPTERQAFSEVAAHALGAANAAELHRRNALVRRVKNVRRRRADALVQQYFNAPTFDAKKCGT